MDGGNHINDKENKSPSKQRGWTGSDVCGPCNGQVSIGRQILASKQEVGIGRNFPCIAPRKEFVRRQHNQVSLIDGKGLDVGKGTLLSEVQTRDDVGGLILFPHQVAVRIEEVYASGQLKKTKMAKY